MPVEANVAIIAIGLSGRRNTGDMDCARAALAAIGCLPAEAGDPSHA